MTEQVQIALIVAIPPTIASVCAVVIALFNQRKLHTVHQQMNSRLDQLLASEKAVSHTEGMKEQRDLNGKKL